MRIHAKLTLAALAAAILLAAAVGTASANRISLSNRNIRVAFNPLIFTSSPEGTTISCPVTIEGSFHSATLAKVANALVGFISRASVGKPSCTSEPSGYDALVDQSSLPWHIRYVSFSGTLPLFTAVRLSLHTPRFILLGPFGVTCTYAGAMQGEARRGGTSTELSANSSPSIPLTAGGFLCPPAGRLSGQARVTLLGTNTDITIRLI
jgi:hypothetical protein